MKKIKYGTISVTLLLLSFLMIGNLTYSENGLGGNEILQKVEEREEELRSGSLISTLRFDIIHTDGTTGYFVFGTLSKRVKDAPDKSLLYFQEREYWRGVIVLTIDPEDPQENTRIWQFSPAIEESAPGQGTKEIISEQQRGSFAGSTFSYREIGRGFDITEDYTGELLNKKSSVTISDEQIPCYVVKLTAKPDADVEYPTGKVWIDEENWLNLKAEDYNRAGNLERTMQVLELGQFERKIMADKIISENVLDNSSTTIIFQKRIRPKEEIPNSVFDPQNLPNFDPAKWGFTK